jgi:SAM-dependent methyltransferase
MNDESAAGTREQATATAEPAESPALHAVLSAFREARTSGREGGPGRPPVDYMWLVCGDVPNLTQEFESVGAQLAEWIGSLGMLGPESRLLDIGCGCGRVALRLLETPIAGYAGFDRHAGMIEWAQSEIGGVDHRFRFDHVDVRSGYEELDHSVGTVSAAEFVFPYEDGSFTGALAASVFTHIDYAATSRYLRETSRVLAPSGRMLASFFVDETTGSMAGSGWNFVMRQEDLEAAVADAGLAILQLHPAKGESRHTWLVLEKSAG